MKIKKRTIKNGEIIVTELLQINKQLNEIIELLSNQQMNNTNENMKVIKWLKTTDTKSE